MRTNRALLSACIASVVALAFGQAARADTTPTTVTVSGATLFQAFFQGSSSSSSTNDYIDVDGNGLYSYNTGPGYAVEELAPSISWVSGGASATYQSSSSLISQVPQWNLVYRSVGSVNGLQELLNTSAGLANPYATTPSSQIAGIWVNGGTTAVYAAGAYQTGITVTSTTGSNLPAAIIDTGTNVAVMDVSSRWGLQAAGTPAWNLRPTQAGYGTNPVISLPSANGTWSNLLVARTVNGTTFQNTGAGANVLFDSPVAISPISVVANPGIGTDKFKATDLQTLYVTGRLPTGENLQAQTRSVGSGTRNGFANSLGMDPSFSTGENIGSEMTQPKVVTTGADPTALGSAYQPTNYNATGDMVLGVRNTRLGVGYVGSDTVASGGTKSGVSNGFGVVQVAFNLNNTTSANYVTPSIETLMHNNATGGWLISGTETMVTVGDPNATAWPGQTSGSYSLSSNMTMSNAQAALYVRNITASIQNFVAHGSVTNDQYTPGQLLGDSFLLTAVPDYVQNATDGTLWVSNAGPNSGFNSAIQNYETSRLGTLDSKFNAPLVSAASVDAGYVPYRNNQNSTASYYSDGSTGGAYRYFYTGASSATDSAFIGLVGGPGAVGGGTQLNDRNKIAGDFNNTGVRNIEQIPAMMAAVANPTQWAFDNRGASSSSAFSRGTTAAIPEILGDFNGDGNFDQNDIRYFADGLSVATASSTDSFGSIHASGNVDRKAGFAAVDNDWLSAQATQWNLAHPTGPASSAGNFFGTAFTQSVGTGPGGSTPARAIAYNPGDSRGDVAGSAAGPSPGAGPTGADGVINNKDIDYVISQIKLATGSPSGVVPVGTMINGGSVDSMGQFSTLLTRAVTNPSVGVRADLSADMTGDLNINKNDLDELVQTICKTRYGDCDLSGTVNDGDLSLLLASYGKSGTGWAQGNFTGTSTVNDGDLSLLLASYGKSGAPAISGGSDLGTFPGSGPAPGGQVPEPASLAVLALGASAVLVRRRRRRC